MGLSASSLTSTCWSNAEVLLPRSPAMAGSRSPKLGSTESHSLVRRRPGSVLWSTYGGGDVHRVRKGGAMAK